MGYPLKQTDGAGTNAPFCSGWGPGTFPTNALATTNAAFGTTEHSATIAANTLSPNVYLYTVISATNEPGAATWHNGTWKVRINHTTGRSAVNLNAIYICRLNAAGESIAVVTNDQALGYSTLSGAQPIEHTFSVPEIAAEVTNRIGVVFGYINSANAARTIGITPDQYIATPIGSNFTELEGRTQAGVGHFYNIEPEFVPLAGRTIGSAQARGELEPLFYVDLSGRVLNSALYYNPVVEPVAPDYLNLSGRTVCSALYYGDDFDADPNLINLNGRVLCQGWTTPSPAPPDPVTVNLAGRTVCLSRSQATSLSFGQVDLAGRTVSVSTPRGVVDQLTISDLTGRTVGSTHGRGQLASPGAFVFVGLQGRTLSRSMYLRGRLEVIIGRVPNVYGTFRGRVVRIPINWRGVIRETDIQGTPASVLGDIEFTDLIGRMVSRGSFSQAMMCNGYGTGKYGSCPYGS